ncbi:MAG: hypothetical protein M1817_004902 [Caeruleum heppii]|nr:MAG: hypothetical protein M1817_004902 [Caeruleum heppii]
MRLSSLLGPTAAEFVHLTRLWPLLFPLIPTSHAINFSPVPSPNLDLSQLGRVGLVGDFDSISLYSYQGQNQNGFSTNGSQSVLTRLPNGVFTSVVTADAYINAMCPFVMRGGEFSGVIVAGNFTSLGGIEAQGIAMVNPESGNVTPLPGLSGKINALLCDETTNTVYVGGEFKGANSTNAIAWVGTTGWTNLPFAGFNGPVTSITKESNGNVVFGGSFDGLGNTTSPRKKDQQVVNIAAADISAVATAPTTGFDDPRNIVCKTDGQDGAGNTWLLADQQPGSWTAAFNFGFQPTKLRLRNAKQEGRGTRTFRFTALPINGIMNLTYVDPATGLNASCDARCPLSDNSTVEFQDFTFVNVIGMSAFRIDISEWYGSGGGLSGIELYQDDIYAFAINDFNEPTCADIELGSNATVTGPWSVMPSQLSSSQYLSTRVSDVGDSAAPSIVFMPDIKQSGNYSVTLYTPGCTQDGSCAIRGRANVTGVMATGTQAAGPIQTEIFQTNNFDKYDQIYFGYVDANSGSFRPSVTVTPSAGQAGLQVVAQRVRFELLSSTGGLNGLYEFDPNQAVASTDFSSSVINQAGTDLDTGAAVTSLVVSNSITYVAGNLSAGDFDNIFKIEDGNSTALPGGGLNAEVQTMLLEDDRIFVGGNFTNTSKADTPGLNNVGAYSIAEDAWQPLGAGVNGRVTNIVALTFNVTADRAETVIAITGNFDQILPFGNNQAAAVSGLAIWVTSQDNWLQFVNPQIATISGQLTAAVNVPVGGPLYAGTLTSQGNGASGAVALSTDGPLSLNNFGVQIQPETPSGSQRKRAVSGQDLSGVVAGYFYEEENRNLTILGGHFTARATDGSTIDNLLFVDGTKNDEITGLGSGVDETATFLALAVQDDILYAGGSITGDVNGADVNGIVLYDLRTSNLVQTQPPALVGDDVAVHAIAAQPNTGNVYVAGSFAAAGSLDCPSLCIYTTAASQWNRPASGLGGSVAAMTWSGTDRLVIGGNLTLNDTATTMATYNAKDRTWAGLPGAEGMPGPVTALSAANDAASELWVAGATADGSPFLQKYDGEKWLSVGDTLGRATRIRGIQILSLSRNHEENELVAEDQALLLTGELELPGFGNASSALFNGTTFTPFVLSNSGNGPGSLSQIFSQKQNFFKSGGGKLAVGFVVLISLAIALALIFILVVVGILAERIRRKREGYVQAPTQMYDKQANMERLPPSHLFGSLGAQGRGPGGAPML